MKASGRPVDATPATTSSSLDVPRACATLADLRREVVALIAAVDTAELPRPHRVNAPDEHLPGPEWRVSDGWAVHAADDDTPDVIYVRSPDAWPGDVTAVEVNTARRLAMALLAACEWADGHRSFPPDVPMLDKRRRPRTR